MATSKKGHHGSGFLRYRLNRILGEGRQGDQIQRWGIRNLMSIKGD